MFFIFGSEASFMHRRDYLTGVAGGLALAAGCSDGGDSGSDDGEGSDGEDMEDGSDTDNGGDTDSGSSESTSGSVQLQGEYYNDELGTGLNDDLTQLSLEGTYDGLNLETTGELRNETDSEIEVERTGTALLDENGDQIDFDRLVDLVTTIPPGETATLEETATFVDQPDPSEAGSFKMRLFWDWS